MSMPMPNKQNSIQRIVSGGQTGADRAGLAWAIRAQIPHGGWCPKGRQAEDGIIPAQYRLVETPLRDYSQRTTWNVRDSDGTVIFSCNPSLYGGSALTQKITADLSRPVIHVHAGLGIQSAGKKLRDFVQQHGIKALNIAGPRESHEPDVAAFVEQLLSLAFIDCPTLPMPAQVLACLHSGYLESAQQLMQQSHVVPEPQEVDAILQDLESQAATQQAQENPRQTKRIQRRILTLRVFREHGLDQEQLIRPVDLAEGYAGKILLVHLHCARSEGTLCLRSGDLWHREILRDTEEEIADLGFDLTIVSPVGGAWIRLDEKQAITLHGSSEEYGECDKEKAAQLIAAVYPHHRVHTKP
jgi:hypothetical protein